MITLKWNNLLNSDKVVICHQVNCIGIMDGGVALQIKKRYPHVFEEYQKRCSEPSNNRINIPSRLMGQVQLIDTGAYHIIANMFAQRGVTDVVNTSYSALQDGFNLLNKTLSEVGIKDVAIPYKMGCGLGGGDWDKVLKIIRTECTDIDVEICAIDRPIEMGADAEPNKTIILFE